jgi:hypothetical protein
MTAWRRHGKGTSIRKRRVVKAVRQGRQCSEGCVARYERFNQSRGWKNSHASASRVPGSGW